MHVFDNNYLLSKEDMPEIKLPDNENCIIRFEVRKNKIYEEIIRVAEEIEADLIVIATEGHNGILDALFGSTSEQVLRHSTCPILSIPVAKGVYMPRYYETLGDKNP